jgi:hypothetical protein
MTSLTRRVYCAALLTVVLCLADRVRGDCTLTSTDKIPLNDLGAGQYLGHVGGL